MSWPLLSFPGTIRMLTSGRGTGYSRNSGLQSDSRLSEVYMENTVVCSLQGERVSLPRVSYLAVHRLVYSFSGE